MPPQYFHPIRSGAPPDEAIGNLDIQYLQRPGDLARIERHGIVSAKKQKKASLSEEKAQQDAEGVVYKVFSRKPLINL